MEPSSGCQMGWVREVQFEDGAMLRGALRRQLRLVRLGDPLGYGEASPLPSTTPRDGSAR